MDKDQKRDLIIEGAAALEFKPSASIQKQDLKKAVTIPWNSLPAIGVALSSIPETIKDINAVAGTGETLFRATDAYGNAIPTQAFQAFKDGSGLMGSTYKSGTFSQIRFHPTVPGATQPAPMIPIDPVGLMAAVAIAQVNKKLDTIQETQKEMFEYLRRKDRAEQEGDLNTLAEVLDNLKFNIDNDTYIMNKHSQVQDIHNRAEKNICLYREEARSQLDKTDIVTFAKNAASKSKKVSESMCNYQFALYIYSFSTFLEVILMDNFDEGYLNNMSEKIKEYSIEYETLYLQCYDALENAAQSALEANVLGGIAFAGKKLGKVIEKTPVGDRTKIDEALICAGDAMDDFKEKMQSKSLDLLIANKENVTKPFVDSIDRVNYLYNQPFELLMDSKNLYLKPIEDDSEQ